MYVRMPLFFSFQLQVFGSVGVETPDIQIYHVNEEGIYTMQKRFKPKYGYSEITRISLFWNPCGQVV